MNDFVKMDLDALCEVEEALEDILSGMRRAEKKGVGCPDCPAYEELLEEVRQEIARRDELERYALCRQYEEAAI